MAQSAKLRFLNAFQSNDKKNVTSNQPDNVQGWLMNVHTYREPEELTTTTIVDAENNSIPIQNPRRNGRPGSITSEDSVNLDDLINANFTADVDDETDLPDLAALDLDDSTDEFWKLDQADSNSKTSYEGLTTKNYDLDWNPTDDDTVSTLSPVTPRYEKSSRLRRSESISSENSFNSQTTITQYAKYGLAPMMHPSESSSTSTRSLSRLSNYSTASSNTTTGMPRPRTSSASTSHNIPTPSRSHTLQKDVSPKRTPIVKRASHIPAPASSYHITSPPTPQRTISSSSSSSSRLRVPSNATQQQQQQQQPKRLNQRASHIPTVRESIHRPNSPLQPKSGRASATPTRMSLRSPTPGGSGGGPRHSLFPPKEEKRQTTTSSLRSPSRIGTLKRTA